MPVPYGSKLHIYKLHISPTNNHFLATQKQKTKNNNNNKSRRRRERKSDTEKLVS